ncbi:uncharacterized protein EHS24_008199 [Apiotrichum porosum]|uniref:Uncharacterized protein n=1 Tax=Apiotrichum porosum TaxID=105984 RepID=A0A427XT51_9TREE|nr:uncharacterized protein EHS24_008199 [Apiotrichum porosum]RSH81997.1 hypothetical protein EHS24_008199 [Apiotrichum porosum]
MEPSVFGSHLRPSAQQRVSNPLSKIIFVNPWHVQRLVEADLQKKNCLDGYERHLLIVAVGLAHELMYLVRTEPYGIKIPYDTPPRNGADLDGGWAFEDALMGGRLEGLWVTDDEPAPVDVTPGEFMGMDLGTIDRTVTTNVRQTVKSAPFDYLAIAKGDQEIYKVCESWVSELIREFATYGRIDRIVFPPSVEPSPMHCDEVKRLGLPKTKRTCVIHGSRQHLPTK